MIGTFQWLEKIGFDQIERHWYNQNKWDVINLHIGFWYKSTKERKKKLSFNIWYTENNYYWSPFRRGQNKRSFGWRCSEYHVKLPLTGRIGAMRIGKLLELWSKAGWLSSRYYWGVEWSIDTIFFSGRWRGRGSRSSFVQCGLVIGQWLLIVRVIFRSGHCFEGVEPVKWYLALCM